MTDSDLAAAIASRDALAEQVEAVRARLEELAAQCPPDDWPSNGDMSAAAIADAARYVLALLEAK